MEVLRSGEVTPIQALRARDEFFWLDMDTPRDEQIDELGRILGLHPLAVADSRNFDQRPKLDDFDDHAFLVFYSVGESEEPDREFVPLEVHLYVSGSFVITLRQRSAPALDALCAQIGDAETDNESLVIYRILRALCDAFEKPLLRLEERVDRLEEAVFTSAGNARLETLYQLRQEVRDLMRRMASQRDHFNYATAALERIPGLTRGPRAELRDIADQLDEIAGELERQNGDIETLISIHFNTTAARVNALATRLTIIATIFLAWTLVTGFFGQNFGWLVERIESREAFLVYGVGGLALATIVGVLAIMLGRPRGSVD